MIKQGAGCRSKLANLFRYGSKLNSALFTRGFTDLPTQEVYYAQQEDIGPGRTFDVVIVDPNAAPASDNAKVRFCAKWNGTHYVYVPCR